jgi:hypothetical protein
VEQAQDVRNWIGPPDVGQQGVEPRDAGTAGALSNVSQQLGPALGVALISTFVAICSALIRGAPDSTTRPANPSPSTRSSAD